MSEVAKGERAAEGRGAGGNSRNADDAGSRNWVSWVIGPVFLVLAAWFVWGSEPPELPIGRPTSVDPSVLTTAPRRTALGDPPTVQVGAFRQTCMDCHRLFPPADDPPKQLMQHTHIKLDHGINDRCRNCHDPKDRNRLVLHGGESIPYERVVELCAKCHGPTHHEWQRGAHGRTNGYWSPAFGPVRKLKCTECHDPHSPRHPAMDPVRPLPPPNTLRMGEPKARDHEAPEERRDPLWPVLDTGLSDIGDSHGEKE